MSNGRAKGGVLVQYNTFLSDFAYYDTPLSRKLKITTEGYKNWGDVLNAKQQTDIPIKREENESPDHWRGKRNIVDLFKEYNENNSFRFLLWTERQQIQERFIEAFGAPRTYRPDIVVFDRIGFSKNHPHFGIYIIEIDGIKNHTNKNEVWKGKVRDAFFFEFYNAVTIRILTRAAHGRKRIFNEFQDLHDEMIYECNKALVVKENT